eukprot:jgi/Chlat1/5341/Chrsp35S05276
MGRRSFMHVVRAEPAAASSSSPSATDDAAAEDKRLVEQIKQTLDMLRDKRDMPFNEVRLTIMIEDPRDTERRERLGIENESGVSRDELAAALMEVKEGKTPQDRAALRLLADELLNWPGLDQEAPADEEVQSPYAEVTSTGLSVAERSRRANEAKEMQQRKRDRERAGDANYDPDLDVDNDEEEKEPGLEAKLPPWLGYGFLYIVSAIPVIIGVTVVVVLFVNSLQ